MQEDSKFDFKKIVSENWIEPPKRERKRKYWFFFFFKVSAHLIFFPFTPYHTLPYHIIGLSSWISYSESEYFKQTMRQGGPAKPKEPRIPRMPQL